MKSRGGLPVLHLREVNTSPANIILHKKELPHSIETAPIHVAMQNKSCELQDHSVTDDKATKYRQATDISIPQKMF